MVKFRGCVFRPNEISAKQNFTWVDAKFQQDDCEISLDSMKIHRCLQNFVEFSQEQIHQISLSFLLHSTVSTVFHKPYSSINVSVKMNLSTCLEQGVADIEMHLHEWLQQWRQLWKLKDIIATGKRPQVHRLVCDHFYYHKLFHYHGYNLLQKGWRHQLIYLAKMVYQTLWN